MALCAANSFAQYTEQAPAGGFDVSKGSDYIVFYAPASFVSKIEANNTMLSNQNLDPNSVTSTCDYWGTNPDLSVCNANQGDLNSWGDDDCFSITPTGFWGGSGTACFRSITDKFDLSQVTDDHVLHLGIMNNDGSSVTKNTGMTLIFGDGDAVKLYAGSKSRLSGYQKVGNLPKNGGWQYVEIKVSQLKSLFRSLKLQKQTGDNFFQFAFDNGTASTCTKEQEPGSPVYTYTITKLGSVIGLDAFFFYKPADVDGISEMKTEGESQVEQVYDLSGRRAEMNRPGVYIIKTNNGTRKVIKK